MSLRRLFPALPALALAAGIAPAPAHAANVTEAVFDHHLLAQVSEPATFRYRYEMTGAKIDQPIASAITMAVREVRPDGAKVIDFDMFDGPNRRQYGPVEAQDQNPLVLVFLQRDVTEMGNLTGGSPEYFRQRIRLAFNAPADSDTTTIQVDGHDVAATRIVMHPFRDDPHIDRFPQFKDKAYEFVVADSVPGGLFSIATSTPGTKPDEGPVLRESVTFESVTPVAAGEKG